MNFRPVGALAAGVLAVVTQQPPSREADALADFPMHDRREAWLTRAGLDAARADEGLTTDPTHPDTLHNLLRRGHYRQATDALKSLPAQAPERIRAAVIAVRDAVLPARASAEPGDFETFVEALAPLHGVISGWPTEDAAAVALPLARLHQMVHGIGKRDDVPDRIRRDYPGTLTVRLMDVDDLKRSSDPREWLASLDTYWRDHPASVDGAKALHYKGYHLAVNGGLPGEDPAPRLAQVVEIIRELESGRYPRCEWTDRAVELMWNFSYPTDPAPAFAPGSVDRMLNLYREFARSHSRPAPGVELYPNSVGYVVTGKMGDLHAVKGDRIGGVERELNDLETHAIEPALIRLIAGEYFASQSTAGDAAIRPAMKSKAVARLTALADEPPAYASRKALATLASLAFYEKDYGEAQRHLERYLAAYPNAGWSWLVAVRLGQIAELTERWESAVTAYGHAATAYAGLPLALVTAEAGRGRALESLGRFAEAREAFQRAAEGWDSRFGGYYDEYTLGQPFLTRQGLLDRASQLSRVLSAPAGTDLARANRLIETRRFAEALDVMRRHSRSQAPEREEARFLRHRAMFELALSHAGIEEASRDQAAALRLLTELSSEPFDFYVAAGEVARASIVLQRDASAASAIMAGALDQLERSRRPSDDAVPASAVEADIRAIRALVFQPAGQLEILGRHWNGYSFPDASPPFAIVNPEFRVKLLRQPYERYWLKQPLPGARRVIWLDSDEIAVLDRIISVLGGTQRRPWTVATDTPNRPVGNSVEIVRFWNRFFPAQSGHWYGWELATYPVMGDLEFRDEARTTAHLSFTVGYAGGFLVLEKVNGVWKAVRVDGRWIT
jgi:tetratricopeptide (TPR) repeat protein